MFFRYSTVRSSDNGFCIGDDTMNPGQKPSSGFWITKHHFQMLQILILSCFTIGSPTVAPNCFNKLLPFICKFSVSEPIQKFFDRIRGGIINYLHMSKTRLLFSLPVSVQRYGAQNDAFPFASTPSLTPFGAEKRFIHLYQASKAISRISVRHRFSNFMGHQPCMRSCTGQFQGGVASRQRKLRLCPSPCDKATNTILPKAPLFHEKWYRRSGLLGICTFCNQKASCFSDTTLYRVRIGDI